MDKNTTYIIGGALGIAVAFATLKILRNNKQSKQI